MLHIDMMYLSMISTALPLILGLVLFKKLPISLKILSVFLIITAALEICAFTMFQYKQNNMVIYHAHTMVEFVCISLIYRSIFRENSLRRKLTTAFLFGFIPLSVLSMILWQGIEQFNSFQRVVEYALLMILFFLFYGDLIGSKKVPFLELHPYFVLTTGFFIYFTGTILLFLSANNLIELEIVNYWMIHGILNISLNLIYFIVLWRGSKMAKFL